MPPQSGTRLILGKGDKGRELRMALREDIKSDGNTPRAITLDWSVVTVSLIGIAVVIAASLQAGDGSLVSTLGSYF
jgi:hypothetical protein